MLTGLRMVWLHLLVHRVRLVLLLNSLEMALLRVLLPPDAVWPLLDWRPLEAIHRVSVGRSTARKIAVLLFYCRQGWWCHSLKSVISASRPHRGEKVTTRT